MAAVLLGLLIASAFGSGDFAGGKASSTSPTVAVLVVGQFVAALGAAVLAVVVASRVELADVGYGAAAGVVNVVGLGLLYRSLARHAAGVVAPITAVVGAVVPVAWGLLHGERPSGLTLAGVGLAIVAAALIGSGDSGSDAGDSPRDTALARGALPAILAGAALGSSLVLYAQTSSASGQVPVFAARAGAFVVAALAFLAMRSRQPVTLPRGHARTLAIAAGVLDVAATALLVVAVRRELLSVVAPLASLAPGWTVVLARMVDGERLTPIRRAGVAVALAALVCMAAG